MEEDIPNEDLVTLEAPDALQNPESPMGSVGEIGDLNNYSELEDITTDDADIIMEGNHQQVSEKSTEAGDTNVNQAQNEQTSATESNEYQGQGEDKNVSAEAAWVEGAIPQENSIANLLENKTESFLSEESPLD